jgi:hypothetical protein
MPEQTTAPEALFDADLYQSLDHEDWVDRLDWIVVDGHLAHAPVAWTWRCPECGASGIMPEGPGLLTSPHGAQHAAGVFGRIIPLEVGLVRTAPTD